MKQSGNRSTAWRVIWILVVILGGLVACASAPEPTDGPEANVATAEASQAQPPEVAEPDLAFPPVGEYSEIEVVRPLVRFDFLLEAADLLAAFDPAEFESEQALFLYFFVGFGEFETGITTRRVATDGIEIQEQVVHTLISRDEEGSWWRLDVDFTGLSFWLEVEMHPLGFPVRVLMEDPADGTLVEREPLLGGYFERQIRERGEESVREELDQQRLLFLQERLDMMSEMQDERLEVIMTALGPVETIRTSQVTPDGTIYTWVSPRVPGELVRIALSPDPAPGEVFYELVEVSQVE